MASAALALLSAASWGGGDFAGGMGVKATGGSTTGALRLVVAAHAISIAVLFAILSFRHAAWPSGAPLIWGLASGLAAGLSLSAFYLALARGAMGASAAVSGLLAAAIPAVVSLWLQGAPGLLTLFGFGCAAAAIWLIAATSAGPKEALAAPQDASAAPRTGTLGLAVIGGVGFGFYFVALRFSNSLGVLEPMALARTGSLVTCLLLLALLRTRRSASTPEAVGPWLSRSAWLWAVGVAVLDTGGNLLFIAATRAGRLDIAAVLASLYPASTILLAAFLLHERPSRLQFVGMAVAILAVVLITLSASAP